MHIKLKSEEFGNHEWLSLKPEKMLSTEAEAIEGVTTLSFVQWGQALLNGSAICGRALVWVLLKRENPPLRFRQVDYPIGALSVELDNEEKAKLRVELARNEDMSEEDRKAIIAALDADVIEVLDFEPGSDEDPASPGNVNAPNGSDTASS